MDLSIVEWFQSLSSTLLDYVVLFITEFGGETVFLAIAALLFWTVNKKYAYRLTMFVLLNVMVNSILKNVFRRPRPFQTDSDVVSIGEKTHGYSMPSGHATNATALALMLNERYRTFKKWVTPLLVTMVVLVALSRVYLGQHYLTDVLAGIAITSVVYLAVRRIAPVMRISTERLVFFASPLLILLLIFVQDENYFIAVAAILGGTLGYHLEAKYIDYDVRAPFVIQVVKFLIGSAVALILKEGLKAILPYPEAENILSLALDLVRYFILALWLTLGAMFTFNKLFP
ncbi:MAG: phosphatase PAP2 family protein, partial [Acholeplasmataceae bacterium]